MTLEIVKYLPQKAIDMIDANFKAAVAEIEGDEILAGCKTFEELHDYCDANCLGGADADDHPFWHDPDYYDPEDGFTDLGAAVIDGWQSMVDAELRRLARCK